eukprot:GFKZ01005511.1.p1 GENE.GFKZ01005511.1~~GFKZ01005511.1.p1  ORF type:complete len:104 (+),score=1.26 GFKZ01005511.1:30-341(+)
MIFEQVHLPLPATALLRAPFPFCQGELGHNSSLPCNVIAYAVFDLTNLLIIQQILCTSSISAASPLAPSQDSLAMDLAFVVDLYLQALISDYYRRDHTATGFL